MYRTNAFEIITWRVNTIKYNMRFLLLRTIYNTLRMPVFIYLQTLLTKNEQKWKNYF